MRLASPSAALLAAVLVPVWASTWLGCGGDKCAEGDCGQGGQGGAPGTSASTGGTGGAAPKETFPCKGQECVRGDEYCDVQQDDVNPDVGVCLPLPIACVAEAAECSCFTGLPTTCTCTETAEGDFAVFCQPTG